MRHAVLGDADLRLHGADAFRWSDALRATWRSRRDFLEALSRWGLLLGGAGAVRSALPIDELMALGLLGPSGQPISELLKRAPRARYWTSTTAKASECTACHEAAALRDAKSHAHERRLVKCLLCAHACLIENGDRGRCRARINVNGELRTLVYGRPITEHVDPIEKKPFYHFLPGSDAYSLATSGCPLRCRFCQNWEISQAQPEDYRADYAPPAEIAGRARLRRAPIIAFTYNEPTVFVEYLTDIARAARRAGTRSVLVSCGFMNEAPLAEMIDVLDAIKIDLKGFSPSFYRQVVGAELAPVLRSIRQVARSGRHLEIVNLVVPTLNDSPAMLTDLAKWLAGEAGPDVPLHFTRFHPDYQLQNLPPTPVATLERAREAAMKQGLRYVYVGNVPGHPGNNTHCPACGKVVVERSGFFVTRMAMRGNTCAACGARIAGVFS